MIAYEKFLSTLPARGATRELGLSWNADKFLSTLPARGATEQYQAIFGEVVISIHAPREGSDRLQSVVFELYLYFYPRSPRGERQVCIIRMYTGASFLSTLPARGATAAPMGVIHDVAISIHAPREGSDQGALVGPGEVEISIHAPREGSDGRGLHRRAPTRSISIHAPREGSDLYSAPSGPMMSISIHAPREGSDCPLAASAGSPPLISIHAPREGSDPICAKITANRNISIHAPREGSDGFSAGGNDGIPDFYPRSPRGERRLAVVIAEILLYFYPRSPRGERPLSVPKSQPTVTFLSTLPARGATSHPPFLFFCTGISIHAPREGSDSKCAEK